MTQPNRTDQLEDVLERYRNGANWAMLAPDDYRAMARQLSRPSDHQIEDFALFVSQAHSWYKHLFFFPPGSPFLFFIDPNAGFDKLISADGKVSFAERTDASQQFHYTWMTTKKYRERFAYLSYSQTAGTSLFVPREGKLAAYGEEWATVFLSDGQVRRLPEDVVSAGTVKVTGMIHTDAASPLRWRDFDKWDKGILRDILDRTRQDWPVESGGSEAFDKIIARWKQISGLDYDSIHQAELARIEEAARANKRPDIPPNIDPEMYVLFGPERRRQQSNMVAAMKHVRQILYD